MNLDLFNDHMKYQGYCLFEKFLDMNVLVGLKEDLDKWLDFAEQIRRDNGLESSMSGVAHNILGRDDAMAAFIKSLPLHGLLKSYFSGPYILNSFSGMKHIADTKQSYEHVQNFHRDVRVFSREKNLMINMIVMLDEFTISNGATKIIPGSHKHEEMPCQEYLDKESHYVTGEAGSVLLFDSNVWHSASKNLSGEPRRALTLNYTKPYIKQQADFLSLVGFDFSDEKDVMDVIGLRSRTPKSHSDWYQAGDKRFYHSDQR